MINHLKSPKIILFLGIILLIITSSIFYIYREGGRTLSDPLMLIMALMGILTMIGLIISIILWIACFFEDFHKVKLPKLQFILMTTISIASWVFIPTITYVLLLLVFLFLGIMIARNFWEDVRIIPMISVIVFFVASLLPYIVAGERPWAKMFELLSAK